MKIIKPSVCIVAPPTYAELLWRVENAGRTCYKSEMKENGAEQFVRNLISRGHEAVIEHAYLTARIICDRGVSHEIVRHRLANYCQESTRYCNYSKDKFGNEIAVVEPIYLECDSDAWYLWRDACKYAEEAYFDLLNAGCSPQEARAVLPNSLKTEVVMTANLREWRHFFRLRTAPAAHPQMREVAVMLLAEMNRHYPVFFEDMV